MYLINHIEQFGPSAINIRFPASCIDGTISQVCMWHIFRYLSLNRLCSEAEWQKHCLNGFSFYIWIWNVHIWFWSDANWISHSFPLAVRTILNPKCQMVEPQRGVPYQSWGLEMQNLISPAAVFLNQELQTFLVSKLNLRNMWLSRTQNVCVFVFLRFFLMFHLLSFLPRKKF